MQGDSQATANMKSHWTHHTFCHCYNDCHQRSLSKLLFFFKFLNQTLFLRYKGLSHSESLFLRGLKEGQNLISLIIPPIYYKNNFAVGILYFYWSRNSSDDTISLQIITMTDRKSQITCSPKNCAELMALAEPNFLTAESSSSAGAGLRPRAFAGAGCGLGFSAGSTTTR